MKSTFFLCVILVVIVNSQDMRFATDCTTPNNDPGLCIEIQNCEKLYNNIVQNKVETYEFIRSSACGPANEDASRPKVCCGESDNFVINAATMIATTPHVAHEMLTPPPPPDHTVLPKMCGKQIIQDILTPSRIIGGKEADIGEFPWLARLVHYSKYNRTGLGCGGFLIHQRYILTAAHCLIGKGIQHLGPVQGVLLGVHNDTKARICTPEMCTDPPQRFEALRTILHIQYDSVSHKNDIALISLRSTVNFTDYIRPICISQASTNVPMYTVSGWGRTEKDASSRTKLKVELPSYDRARCTAKYQQLGLAITENQICAGGEPNHDSCSGDSGGPLMAVVSEEMVWYAEGIVSYGNNCGRDDWPGVYTYIPKYYDWIVSTIKDDMKTSTNPR